MAREKFAVDVAPALIRMDPKQASAMLEIAGNMYADWAHAHGVHTFNPSQYGTFLQVAVGGTTDAQGVFHGGIGYWNNVPVVLPAKQSQAQFDRVFTGIRWGSDARKPVYSSGAVMPPEKVRQLTPVQRSDGLYEFHGPGGNPIPNDHGGIFTLDLAKLGRKYLR